MAGSGSKFVDEGKKKARIEIIPLIDVIFFLLATFTLFILSLDKIQSLPVDLPVAQPPSSTQPPEDETVTLQVSEQGNCYWTYHKVTELIDLKEVKPKLENYAAQIAEPRVLITTDDKAKFGVAVRVLDEVRKANIKKVSVETRVRPTGR
ncbi:MAG: biopolymer transporter ExbD [Cephaloticoccus sp.]|nr:biopolymer transporter ExbD [Cephaloticoccus sp.]MCF7760385.1 biopolymer transporter ExbD [Cephaloticoccus sp.]